MNTDDRRGRPDEEPVLIGAALHDVEARLREALASDARRVAPSDRLTAILDEANAATVAAGSPTTAHRSRWLMPAAAAAAAAAVVAGSFWVAGRPSDPTQVASSSTTSTTAPAPTGNGAPSSVPTEGATPTTGPTSAPPAVSTQGLPVYYVGPRSGAADATLGLFREFVPTDVAGADPETRALAALRLAMGPAPAGSTYVPAWQGVTPQMVTVASDRIIVRLSAGSSAQGDVAKLATEQLVWTVQAAAGKGTLPVTFELTSGGPDVAAGHPASKAYNRPTDQNEVYTQLAPIWVDEPARGTALRAGALVVKGQASTFEANVQWQVLRIGAEVDKGFTTARIGAPARGAYEFRTKALTAGSYVVRVFELSAKDGSVVAEQRVPFTVR